MRPRILAGVFLLTFSTLMFEVNLAAMFVASTGHHFASVVVSTALLGIGAAGIFLRLSPAMLGSVPWELTALALSLSYPVSMAAAGLVAFDPVQLDWTVKEIFNLLLYYPIFAVPFFLSSLVVVSVMKKRYADSGKIYFADMAGAALGGAGFLVASHFEKMPVIISTLFALAGFHMFADGASKGKKAALSIIPLLLLAVLYPRLEIPLSPYKELSQYRMFPGTKELKTFRGPEGRADVVSSPLMRHAPGLNPIFGEAVPPGTGIFLNGDLYAVVPKGSAEYLKHLPATLPYRVRDKPEVLIIGANGLTEAHAAASLGAGRVTVVEEKKIAVNAIKETAFRGYELIRANPRAFLMKPQTFDIISIPYGGQAGVGAGVLSENFLLTREFIELCLKNLKAGGLLVSTMPLLPPPRGEARLLRLMAETGDGPESVAAFRSWGTFTVIRKNGKFSGNDIRALRREAKALSLDAVYYPGMEKGEANRKNRFDEPVYYESAQKALRGEETLFKTEPPSDDAPFFGNYLRLSRFTETRRALDGRWLPILTGGGMDFLIIAQAGAVSFVMLLLPLFLKKGRGDASMWWIAYFLFLGAGYMAVEIVFIQKGVLLLGGQVRSAALVIPLLLGSSAIGGYFSAMLKPSFGVFIAIAAFLIAVAFSGAGLSSAGGGALYGFLFSCSVAACGFVMGIPYPLGLRVLGATSDETIPWGMAANGFASVIGAAAGPLLALLFGFSNVLILAAVVYVAAGLAAKKAGGF